MSLQSILAKSVFIAALALTTNSYAKNDGKPEPADVSDLPKLIANIQDQVQKELGEKIYENLQEKKIEVLLDDRSERAGVKFKDADLIGIPWRIVVGRDAVLGKIELIERANKEMTLLSYEKAINKLLTKIFTKRS